MATSQSEKTRTSSGADDVGQAEVQARFDEANAKGYFGSRPDRDPDEAFTLAGVTKSSK
jgi:hypothetical protein